MSEVLEFAIILASVIDAPMRGNPRTLEATMMKGSREKDEREEGRVRDCIRQFYLLYGGTTRRHRAF